MSLILFGLRVIWILLLDYDLYPEETQYWLWSTKPDLSYYSKPPLIAYINFISTSIFGNTELGIKINALVVGLILPLIVYNLSFELIKDSRVAFYSALILMAMPFYHIISLFFLTDTLVVLFWTLSFLYLYKAIQWGNNSFWVLTGVFSGLAVLSKYTGVLFFLSLLLYAFFFNKGLFKIKGFYYVFIIAALICSPMLFWIVDNDFISFKHLFESSHLGMRVPSTNKALNNIEEYFVGQMLAISPILAIPLALIIFRKNKERTNPAVKKGLKFILVPLLMTWILFFPVSFNGIEINWLFFTYSFVPIILSYLYLKYLNTSVLKICMAITIFLVFIYFVPSITDYVFERRIYRLEVDTLQRLSGWSDLGDKVGEIINQNKEKELFVFSDHYHIASQLAFYLEGNPTTYCLNLGRRMNQFDLWEGIDKFNGTGCSAIYVSRKEAPPDILAGFTGLVSQQTYESYYRGELIQKYYIYFYSGFKSFEEEELKSY